MNYDAGSDSMRMILAIVQPFKVEEVKLALHALTGLTGATFSAARGFGRGRQDAPLSDEAIKGTTERVRVEVVVPAAMENIVVEAIQKAAHTGNRGDGKIFVLSVQRGVRISTGEEGAGV